MAATTGVARERLTTNPRYGATALAKSFAGTSGLGEAEPATQSAQINAPSAAGASVRCASLLMIAGAEQHRRDFCCVADTGVSMRFVEI